MTTPITAPAGHFFIDGLGEMRMLYFKVSDSYCLRSPWKNPPGGAFEMIEYTHIGNPYGGHLKWNPTYQTPSVPHPLPDGDAGNLWWERAIRDEMLSMADYYWDSPGIRGIDREHFIKSADPRVMTWLKRYGTGWNQPVIDWILNRP